MPRFYCVLFFVVGLLAGCVQPALAQQNNPTINGDFRGLRFEEFARRVEAQTPYRFYFKSATLDTVTVHVQADNVRLLALLSQVFAHTTLQFAIDEATNRVFITPERPLQTQVPSGIFQSLPPGATPVPD
ncbi:MAG: hypothetical protein EOO62_14485, partial [Hymenobacter sp.]